jgi:hypothetical protein
MVFLLCKDVCLYRVGFMFLAGVFVFLFRGRGFTYREAPATSLVPWAPPLSRQQVHQPVPQEVAITSTTASLFRVARVVAPSPGR